LSGLVFLLAFIPVYLLPVVLFHIAISYGPGDVRTVTETSTLAHASSSPRVARLMNAERACLEVGGCCLRLAGLYDLQRGPHNYWITSEKDIPSSPDGIINMLHYDDAASACLAALKAGPAVCSGKAFLISDGHPLTRYGICQNALKAAAYEGYSMPKFAGSDDQSWDLGKIYDGSMSNAALKWSPKYKSFENFMEANT
jgi:nucleoside-diphosphate-sugar epimerase